MSLALIIGKCINVKNLTEKYLNPKENLPKEIIKAYADYTDDFIRFLAELRNIHNICLDKVYRENRDGRSDFLDYGVNYYARRITDDPGTARYQVICVGYDFYIGKVLSLELDVEPYILSVGIEDIIRLFSEAAEDFENPKLFRLNQ